MRRYDPRSGVNFVDALEVKQSPSVCSLSGLLVAPAVMHVRVSGFDDPLPGPEPPPSYPGGEPPIEYPVLPPSGPAGPGS
jgi:hypothetical protein